MKNLPIKGITAGFIGLLTTATLGIAQQAQAGNITASSNVSFKDVTMKINGTNIVPQFINTVQGGGGLELDGNIDNAFDNNANKSCSLTPISVTATGSVPNGSVNGGATINCLSGLSVNASNFANIALSGNVGEGSSFGEYTIFTPKFDVKAGDKLDLEGLFTSSLKGKIEGWKPGDVKAVNANYTATFSVMLDDVTVFTAPAIENAESLVNVNDSFDITVTDFNIGALSDYTFLGNGKAEVQFFAREQTSANILRTVPEPSALISLASLGIVALVSRKKNNNANN